MYSIQQHKISNSFELNLLNKYYFKLCIMMKILYKVLIALAMILKLFCKPGFYADADTK